ncbi:MAG: hypothetical protein V1844_21555 [Pseudomonadota bacterium]
MDLIRVNLSLEKEVWCAFDALAPKRSKSRIINQLLKKEIDKLNRERETEALASAFKLAAKDKNRLASLQEWEILDKEGWD